MPRRPKYVTDPTTFNAEFDRIVKLRTELSQRLKEVNDLITSLEEQSHAQELAPSMPLHRRAKPAVLPPQPNHTDRSETVPKFR
jgi:hypothetical protein